MMRFARYHNFKHLWYMRSLVTCRALVLNHPYLARCNHLFAHVRYDWSASDAFTQHSIQDDCNIARWHLALIKSLELRCMESEVVTEISNPANMLITISYPDRTVEFETLTISLILLTIHCNATVEANHQCEQTEVESPP